NRADVKHRRQSESTQYLPNSIEPRAFHFVRHLRLRPFARVAPLLPARQAPRSQLKSLPMIQRYSRAEMREIWSEQRKLEIWLRIELLALEALVQEGLVPKADFQQIAAKAAFDVERCKELERTLNHDVIAFTTNVAENIGKPASRWLHFGLTSSDIIDTAFAVQMVQSADILIEDVK